MIKSFSSLLIATLWITVLMIASCGGAPSLTTPTTTTTPPITTTPPTTTPTTTTLPTTTPPTTTWGELANRGKGTFFGNCAPCHGDDGQGDVGPAIIGPNLAFYGTAQQLFDFISEAAPMDSPGSLSNLSYLRILAFLLVESNLIQPEEVLDESNLANVPLNE